MAKLDLTKYGISGTTEIVHNPSYDELFAEETKPGLEGYEKGQVSELGAVNVMTGIYTGRSPKDKFIVMDENSKDTVWWTSEGYKNDNKPASQEAWNACKDLAIKELSNKRLFVVDAFCGANKDTRMAIRFIMEVAWQAHFVTNMFIKPTAEELENFEPDFVVYNASKAKVENYKELGLNSTVERCVTSREQVILNTWYGGEMKKGMFSMMNYYLPLKGIAAMHCSANTDLNGEKHRHLLRPVRHRQDHPLHRSQAPADRRRRARLGRQRRVQLRGRLLRPRSSTWTKIPSPTSTTPSAANALLENVTLDENGKIDFHDKSVTENTRVSYPIDHIEKIVRPVSAAARRQERDLPVRRRLRRAAPGLRADPRNRPEYYFLSGFTAKLAGTERGITEPTPTFSACFGQAFLELHPTKYAEELVKRMKQSGAKAYLVNTGWNGTGKRISIKDTRGIIDAILDGSIKTAPTKTIPYFNFEVPTELPGVDPKILDPRDTYADAAE